MGVVNILKTLSQSGGPWVTGLLAGHGHFWVAFVAAGSLKATYDVLLLAFFAGRVAPKDSIVSAGQDEGIQREGEDRPEAETDRLGEEEEGPEAQDDSLPNSSSRP
jgi:hypothetical protein